MTLYNNIIEQMKLVDEQSPEASPSDEQVGYRGQKQHAHDIGHQAEPRVNVVEAKARVVTVVHPPAP